MKKKTDQVASKVLLWGTSLLIVLALISGVIILASNNSTLDIIIPSPGPRIPPIIATTANISPTSTRKPIAPMPAPPPQTPTPKPCKIS